MDAHYTQRYTVFDSKTSTQSLGQSIENISVC